MDIEVRAHAREPDEGRVHHILGRLRGVDREVWWPEERIVVELEHGVVVRLVERVASPVRGQHRHEHRQQVVELTGQFKDHHGA